jgi:phosphoribosyl 1,2-cyclic phosphate phosphodiesterase
MKLKFTILGCGSSGGVPRIGGDWGICDPANIKNRRRRCSMLVEAGSHDRVTRVLIDTSPDLRDQMLTAGIKTIDAVWITHEHADHTHGIDDIRSFFLRQRSRIPVWADTATIRMLATRFAYIFTQPAGSQYPAIAAQNLIEPYREISCTGIGGTITAQPFIVHHGDIDALGFRFGDVAYTPDLNGVPDTSMEALSGLELWIVDALKRTPHPSHFALDETLRWIEELQPKQAILTNMHIDMDYETLCKELPPNVRPAFDGMTFEIDARG